MSRGLYGTKLERIQHGKQTSQQQVVLTNLMRGFTTRMCSRLILGVHALLKLLLNKTYVDIKNIDVYKNYLRIHTREVFVAA